MTFVFECCLKDPFKCSTGLLSGLLCHLLLNSSADIKSWNPPEPRDQTDDLVGGGRVLLDMGPRDHSLGDEAWDHGKELLFFVMRVLE